MTLDEFYCQVKALFTAAGWRWVLLGATTEMTQVGTRPPGEDEPPPADPALAELDRIGKVLMAAGWRHDADGHASQPPAYDEMAGIVGTLARTAATQEDVRRAARALLYLYDTEPEASDGPEADAAWAALREAMGDEEPTP